MFTVAAKYQQPKIIENKAGIYITCNNLPQFDDEQENVERRLAIYPTKSLSHKSMEAPKWMEDNAMQCLAWMANELNRNVDLIESDERFYEKTYTEVITPDIVLAIPPSEMAKLQSVSSFDLAPVEIRPTIIVDDYEICHEFIGEENNGKF